MRGLLTTRMAQGEFKTWKEVLFEMTRSFRVEQEKNLLPQRAAHSAQISGWVVINPITGPSDMPGEAWVNIHVQDAAGRTVNQVAEEIRTTTDPGFNITIEEIQIDGGDPIVVDGLPGLDSNRLYTLAFLPWHPGKARRWNIFMRR